MFMIGIPQQLFLISNASNSKIVAKEATISFPLIEWTKKEQEAEQEPQHNEATHYT